MRPLLSLVLLLPVAAAARAQRDLVGPNQYPEMRGISGLPGGGFGVTPDGYGSIEGALSYSTPIAYSLRQGRSAFALSSISRDGNLRFGRRGGGDVNTDANGTGVAMFGLNLGRFARLSAAYEVYSGKLDQGYNFLLTPTQRADRVQFAIGVLDITGESGRSGEGIAGDDFSSASPFVVATAPLPRGVFVSAGIGDRRYRYGFASVSAPVLHLGRIVLEHDGFNFNAMLGYSPAGLRLGPSGALTLHAGLTRMKYATVGFSLTF